jgi:FAD/FMN-containing dehydrogenase/Fe-S oxidoreductase
MGEAPEIIAEELAEVVRGDVYCDILHRAAYSTDASIYQIVPTCVVAPRDRADVVAVVKYASAKGVPVVARGGGSGVAGESLGSGIVFDMTRYMNRILGLERDTEIVLCEPGVVLEDVNNFLAGYNRKIGPDPSSSNRATVGGCVANNSTGAHSLQYGYIGDYVESIEAVLADGSVVEFKNDFAPQDSEDDKLAAIANDCLSVLSDKQDVINKAMPKTRRNRSGYALAGIFHNGKIDLARLLSGSEGTLGIFTKIALRTVAVPAAKALVQFEFASLEKMAKAVPIIVRCNAAACELMDKTLIDMAADALPAYRDLLPADAAAVLLVEHTGETAQQVEEKTKYTDSQVGALAQRRKRIFDVEEQRRLWQLRKDAVPLLDRKKSRKHPVPFIEDVSVGNEQLGEYISRLQEIGRKYDIAMSFYGHAGDGELHVRPYLDLSEPDEVEKMRLIANDVFSLAWSLGGSVSGEHADGLVRAAFIKQQYGQEVYELMRQIKKIFDPQNIMNPGKIISDDDDVMVRNLRSEHKLLPERLKTALVFPEEELAVEVEQCSGCGLCLSRQSDLRMCPVFRALGDELSSSRAKANMLRFWMSGQLKKEEFESPEFKKFLDLCINCKACSLECPSGVDVSRLMAFARVEYARRRGLKAAEATLSHHRYLSIAASVFAPVFNLITATALFRRLLEKAVGLDRRRLLPRFSRRSFLSVGRKYLASCEPIAKPVDKVAYFVDSYAAYNDHELGFAVLEVLRHNDIEVTLPRQRPAPLPAMVYGNVRAAQKDLSFSVRHLAEAVREGYKIICSEPSSALCLKSEMRHFIRGEDAELVAENTYELMGYLLDLFRDGKLKSPEQKEPHVKRGAKYETELSAEYVYHCPCHLFAIGGEGASIELLNKVCGVKVTDLNAGCCGLAGTFGMQRKNYELSAKIAEGLKKALQSTPVKNVLTECSACKMQIEHISAYSVSHPIKVIAACYGIKD